MLYGVQNHSFAFCVELANLMGSYKDVAKY